MHHVVPLPPRVPAHLAPTDAAAVSDDARFEERELSGDLSGSAAARVELLGCRLSSADLTAVVWPEATFCDVELVGCELSGALLEETAWTRVVFRGCRMRGAVLSLGKLRDVTFVDCLLDDAQLRLVEGDRVRSERCSLAGADLYALRAANLVLDGCDLSGADLSQADLHGARLHGSRLEELRGVAALAGAVIDPDQVLPVALQLFTVSGIVVDEEPGRGA